MLQGITLLIGVFISFRSKYRAPIKIPQTTDDESLRHGKRSRASRKKSVSGRSATEDESTGFSDDDDDDTTIFGGIDDHDTTTETDWTTPVASNSTSRKTRYSSSVNSRVSSIQTPRSKLSTRQARNESSEAQSRVSSRPPSESSFIVSRRNSYSDPSGRETRNRSRTTRDSSVVSNRNNSRWSKHSEGGYSISSRRTSSRKAWTEDEQPGKYNRQRMSRQNSKDTRSRLQSRDSSRNVAKNDFRKGREPLSRKNSKIEETAKRKRIPKKKDRPVLKRSRTQGSNISRASTISRGGRKQAWGPQGRGLGPRANTRPALRRNESFASVSSVASVYSRQQKKMVENIYKMAFDAGVARGMSMSGRSGSERSRSKLRTKSKSRSRRNSVTSYTSEDDDEDYPSAPGSRRSSRRNSDNDSVHLSSVRDSEGKSSLD